MNVPIKQVSLLMGHSSVQVTERYLRLNDDTDLRPIANKYSRAIRKISKKNGCKSGSTFQRTKNKKSQADNILYISNYK